MNAALIRGLLHVRALHLHFPRPLAVPIQRAVERAAARSPTALAVLFETDKGPHRHLYTDHYKRLFGPFRKQRITLLEIGIHKGASLRLWRRFLPKAKVIGIDLEPPDLVLPRVEMYAGDQSDETFLREVAMRHAPLDVVVDDGSHVASHIRASFEVLFPALSPGGWYVIEDLETSYRRDEYEGGPPGTPGTAVELVKALIDRAQVDSGMHEVAELHVYEGIAFIRKSGADDTLPGR